MGGAWRRSSGHGAAAVAMVIALIVARPLLGNLPGAFQYIQEFTGFFTPGIVAIFFLGFFWKKATALSALVAAVGSALLSLLFKFVWPSLPFMDRVGLVFLICIGAAVAITLLSGAKDQPKAVRLDDIDFSTSKGFNWASAGVVVILVALYAAWW